ncbi:MAG: APC family permease [Acidimicrobiales bacterium]|nr:APC family permease [Acidimicrobiales bacterium]MBO0893802.1 APC family permease [Acidimicrobiales bacterium]
MWAWRALTGRPLRFSEATKEQIEPLEGLPALSLDALTSVAYGPEAIIVVLATAGAGALSGILPITGAIVVLLVLLVLSYLQVIDAYPGGGGAYAVSRENLGRGASQLAAAALIVDYTLTVAVSIAAGVASMTSAFPSLAPSTVPICLGLLALITLLNIRGLGESARAFLLPTLIFIGGILAVIVIGLIHPLAAHAPEAGRSLVATGSLATVDVLLVLKAFASGCSALTGVEAIANSVPQFRPPRASRAKQTELLLGGLLIVMLLGLAVLADRFHIGPRSGQTVLSQIIGASIGRNAGYYIVELSVTVALGLAANTSFGGLPVLTSLLARDNYLPHAFGLRGDRLTFTTGIWTLAILSGALLVAVGGDTNRLIPLFAVGVFTGFTLSQTGLVVHWRRARPRGWGRRALLNGLGAVVTAVATVILLATKFTEGAWVVVIAVPVFILLFQRIHRYYGRVGQELALGSVPPRPRAHPSTVIVPLTAVTRLTAKAISDARSLGDEVVAVTVELEDESALPGHLSRDWELWHPGVRLVTLRSEYSSIVKPMCDYIDRLRAEEPERVLLVLIPVIVPRRLRHRLLHNHLDLVLSAALRQRTDVVVGRVLIGAED